MTSIVNSSITKVAAIIVAVSLVAGFAFTFTASKAQAATLTDAQISSIISLLQSFGADASTISNVSASLHGTATTGSTTSTTSTNSSCGFTRDLTLGSKGADVTCLQNALIAAGYSIPAGATGYFGAQTQAAVVAWQKKAGVTPTAGYFGAKSRAAFGSSSSSTTTTTTTTTPAAGTGLSVVAGSQPTNSLSPQGATRVPFTRFTLTAGNDGDVVVNGVTVQKDGLGNDAAFAGVVLVDESTGMQLDIAKTFNSNHQAIVGGTFTVPRGTSKSFLIAGNMNASLSSYAGEAPGIALVAVNTSATVSGSLPIVGAHNTNNSTLTLGSLTINTSSYDPNTAGSQPIGTTGFRFSGLRLTAGSAEDITLRSVRWNQSGSVGANDLANVVTVVSGTSYPTTVSSDGKYFTTTFPSGIVISKGNSVDMYVQGDLVGSSAASRVVEFDIYKNTDLYASGNTYGYGVTAPAGSGTVSTAGTHATVINTSSNPWFQGSTLSVTAGSVTTIAKANEVAAQNVAVNVPNQPLGGYATNFSGEPVSVQSSVFTVASTTGSGYGLLTNVSIVNENGSVVAGPVDATYTSALVQTLTFTDTITYPVGRHVYTLRGKIASTVGNGGTYIVKVTPSTGWTSVTGQTTGNTVSLSAQSSVISMNTMTVKGAQLSVNLSSTPSAQNVVAGSQGYTLANYQLDATQSGEDVRLSSIPVKITVASGAAAGDLTGCQLYDGTTALNTGGNVVNTFTSGTAKTYSFDQGITVTKGTVKTLALKCNVSSAAATNGTYVVNYDNTDGDYSISGSTSGNSVTVANGTLTLATSNGGTMTVKTGTFTVTSATGSVAQPSLAPAAAGTNGVTMGYVKVHATNENVNLTKLGLTLVNGTYGTLSTGSGASSNSGAGDVVTAYVYSGSTLVGSATFTGSNTTATSTFSSPLALTKDTDTTLTIKADLRAIGVSSSAGIGDTVKIDPLNAEGSGASSGATTQVSATAGVNGVQLVASYPTVAFVSNTTSPQGTNVVLKKFTVTANSTGSVGLYQMQVALATSSANVTSVKLYAYQDSGYSQGVSSQSSGTGQIGSTACASGCTANQSAGTTPLVFTTATNPVTIPAGTTYYFAVVATVAPSTTTWTVSSTLQGDSAGQTGLGATPGYIATTTTNVATANFVWSDNATTTAAITGDVDWFNGYQVPGLPSTGI